MRICTIFILSLIIFVPVHADAAWYWLVNNENSGLSDFVEMSALEYAETTVSKDLFYYIEDDFFDTLQKAKGSSECTQQYEDTVDSLENVAVQSTSTSTNKYGKEDRMESVVNRAIQSIGKCFEDIAKQLAIENCDFDFFDEMTNSEKMDTWDERDACNKKAEEKEVVSVPVSTTPIVAPVPAPVVPAVTYSPPVQAVTDFVVPDALDEVPSPVESSTSTGATSTPEETITVTQEELDRMVQEKLKEPEIPSKPMEKPSFIKRVVSFLFGWFN
jgi:hypothetical protein